MDLTYRILWLDDQPEELEGNARAIEQKLNTIGLKLSYRLITTFETEEIAKLIRELKAYCPYDLIMVDYNLGTGSGGEKLLRKLRSIFHGEMIFYSASFPNVLRSKLMENGIDGVFCTNRPNLKNQVHKIAESALRRIVHPNYMRGLVVGSVSELEQLFTDLTIRLYKNLEKDEDELLAGIIKSKISFLQNEIDDLEHKHINGHLKLDRVIRDLNLRVKSDLLLELLEESEDQEYTDAQVILEGFLDDINQHRVEFAHAVTKEENGVPVFRDRKNKLWGPKEMKNLLLDIRKYKDTTSSLYERILSQGK